MTETAGWRFAIDNQRAIDSHWQKRAAEMPGFFNGTIYMLASHEMAEGRFAAVLRPVEFKSFLYWRETGYPDAGLIDVFGSALIRSVEGHVLLGRQRAGNVNSGLSYLPGGFIDGRDVAEDGSVDIAASILREVWEETGIDPADLERVPGFILTQSGPQVSIAVELRSPLRSDDLRAAMLAAIAREADPELDDIVVVRSGADIASIPMPRYATALLRTLLP